MRKLFTTLADLKLTVILVLLIGVVLSAGTILESSRGAEAAKGVYEASWFYLLQGVFALNIEADGCPAIFGSGQANVIGPNQGTVLDIQEPVSENVLLQQDFALAAFEGTRRLPLRTQANLRFIDADDVARCDEVSVAAL